MALEGRGSSLWKPEFPHLDRNLRTCTWVYLSVSSCHQWRGGDRAWRRRSRPDRQEEGRFERRRGDFTEGPAPRAFG